MSQTGLPLSRAGDLFTTPARAHSGPAVGPKTPMELIEGIANGECSIPQENNVECLERMKEGLEMTLYQLTETDSGSRVTRKRINMYFRHDRYFGSFYWTEVTPSYVSPRKEEPAPASHRKIPIRTITDVWLDKQTDTFRHPTAASAINDLCVSIKYTSVDGYEESFDLEADCSDDITAFLIMLTYVMSEAGRHITKDACPLDGVADTASNVSTESALSESSSALSSSSSSSASAAMHPLMSDQVVRSLDDDLAQAADDVRALRATKDPTKRRFSVMNVIRMSMGGRPSLAPPALSKPCLPPYPTSSCSVQDETKRVATASLPVSQVSRTSILSEVAAHLRPQLNRELTSSKGDVKHASHAVRQELEQFATYLSTAVSSLTEKVQSTQTDSDRVTASLRNAVDRERASRKALLNQLIEEAGNIRVFARVRPLLEFETKETCVTTYTGDVAATRYGVENDEGVVEVIALDKSKQGGDFTFDKVFGESTTQAEVSKEVLPFVQSCIDGYNVCIFAYGQTGSGKTYTMEGPRDNPGVNYRALNELFDKTVHQQDALVAQGQVPVMQYTITMSVIEIYNESPRDLLSSAQDVDARKIDIRLGESGVYIPDLTMCQVNSVDEVRSHMDRAYKARSVTATRMNEQSSRSHCALFVTVHGKNIHTGAITQGKLALVDLAGSERVEKSGAVGQTLKEAQNINKSLSALGDVIAALQSKEKHVPYRNSKLTFLLQDCLGGNAKCLMFCNVSPALTNHNETLCALRFASRARNTQLGKAKKNIRGDGGKLAVQAKEAQFKAEQESKAASIRADKVAAQVQELQETLRTKDKRIMQLEQQLETISIREEEIRAKDRLIRELQGRLEQQTKEISKSKYPLPSLVSTSRTARVPTHRTATASLKPNTRRVAPNALTMTIDNESSPRSSLENASPMTSVDDGNPITLGEEIVSEVSSQHRLSGQKRKSFDDDFDETEYSARADGENAVPTSMDCKRTTESVDKVASSIAERVAQRHKEGSSTLLVAKPNSSRYQPPLKRMRPHTASSSSLRASSTVLTTLPTSSSNMNGTGFASTNLAGASHITPARPLSSRTRFR